jgi:hypothetical protein
LTEIIKQEWESVWPTALNDLAATAVKNQVLCENNLEIMLMLSEEIFEFAKNNLTKADTAVLQAKYTENLKVIYQLCEYVCKEYLKNSSQVSLSLMKIAMKTIQTLLTWAPLSYIFGTDLIQNILIPILQDTRFTTVSLQCLTEIYSFNVFKIDLQPQELEVIKGIIIDSMKALLSKMNGIIPENENFAAVRQRLLENKELYNQLMLYDNIYKEISHTITAFFKTHFNWLFDTALILFQQSPKNHYHLCDCLNKSIKYMLNIAAIRSDTIYKITMDFWEFFTAKRVELKSSLFLPRKSRSNQAQRPRTAVLRQQGK